MMTEPLRFALLGHPVSHSISPAIHQAAYASLGLPHCYELCSAQDEPAVRRCLALLRDGHFAGLNVTVPWKRLALELSDHVDPLARHVGAANVLLRGPSGALEAYNTDVLALHEELATRSAGVRSVSIIGSGGAALAALAAARRLGAEEFPLIARSFCGNVPESLWPHAEELRRLGASVLAWPEPGESVAGELWRERVSGSQIIIQATSAGMHGADQGERVARLVPWELLHERALAYDVVYNPPITPFLRSARARGLLAEGGLGMLVGQAVHAFELWLKQTAPRGPMQEAARRALQDMAQT
jgi:shikimate dehydrogenase